MKRRRRRKGCLLGAILAGVLALGVGWMNLSAGLAASGMLYDDPRAVPGGRVGIVFGTSPWIGERDNLYFRYRIEAAAELWKAGKLRCIIVSGDNGKHSYNEPKYMIEALVEAGVPREVIQDDCAGFRTLATVYRAQRVFQADKVTFISQRFQNERAAYLAKSRGIDFVGYNARDVEGHGGLKTKVREVAARVRMWLDVNVLHTEPRYYGDPIKLPR